MKTTLLIASLLSLISLPSFSACHQVQAEIETLRAHDSALHPTWSNNAWMVLKGVNIPGCPQGLVLRGPQFYSIALSAYLAEKEIIVHVDDKARHHHNCIVDTLDVGTIQSK